MKPRLFSARAVIFDWDGTLLDSFTADSRAYAVMFAALSIRWTTKDLERHYHPDWYHVYRAAQVERVHWTRADKLWREAYRRENPQLMPGVAAVLHNLRKDFTLALVTSGDRRRVRRQLRYWKLTRYFSACVCSEDCARKKPDPAPLRAALRLLNMTPEKCIYVGDAPQDVEMARRARVRSIGVFGPFPTANALRKARPDLLLNSIRELPRHLIPASATLSEEMVSPTGKKARAVTSVVKRKTQRSRRSEA